MPESCCFVGCTTRRNISSRTACIHLFWIPINHRRRAAWVTAVSWKNWQPKNWEWVCGKHFVSGFPSEDPNDVDYRPTLHMKGQTSRVDTSSVLVSARRERATRRKLAADMAQVATVRLISTELVFEVGWIASVIITLWVCSCWLTTLLLRYFDFRHFILSNLTLQLHCAFWAIL